MNEQGGDFLDQPRTSVQPSQEQIEAIITVIEQAQDTLSALGYPTFLHVFAPGEHRIRDRLPERHIFTLVGPVAGPVDLWRQAARRSRT
jgi:hypothetical protein